MEYLLSLFFGDGRQLETETHPKISILKQTLLHQAVNLALWDESDNGSVFGLFLRKDQKQHIVLNHSIYTFYVHTFQEKIQDFSKLSSNDSLEFVDRRKLFCYPFRDWNSFPYFVEDIFSLNSHLIIVLKRRMNLFGLWVLSRSKLLSDVPTELKRHIFEFYGSYVDDEKIDHLLRNKINRWIYITIPLIDSIRILFKKNIGNSKCKDERYSSSFKKAISSH